MTDQRGGRDWTPMSQRAVPTGDYAGLHEGVPSWLWDSLMGWVEGYFRWRTRDGYHRYDDEGLLLFERKRRYRLEGDNGSDKWDDLKSLAADDDELFLDLVDFALFRLQRKEFYDVDAVGNLQELLEQTGSTWKVTERGDGWGLERRVEETATAQAELAMAAADRPAEHLRLAWSNLYGRSPDSSGSYREAVRAVEAAAKPVVSPSNTMATLGTMIRALEDAPQNFEVALNPPPPFSAVDGVIAAMKLVWKSQLDRHGTDDETAPFQVGPEEAEMSLHLAVTLVHWFRNGLVTRA